MSGPFALVAALLAVQDSGPGRVVSVPEVDLARYAGRWHEVARLPNKFQGKCVGETTADYELLAGGAIRVVNACRGADGRITKVEGRARLANRDGPTSRLKVRFAPAILSWLPMVWGDYWVLELTPDYGAALVGTPDRKYLWVLSRTAQLDDSIQRRLVATAAAQGFDVARLILSSPPPPSAPAGPVSRRADSARPTPRRN